MVRIKTEIEEKLDSHKLWLKGDRSNERLNLKNIEIKNISFRKRDFSKGHLINCYFSAICLTGAKFRDASLKYTTFEGREDQFGLKNVCFLDEIDFTNADLENVKFGKLTFLRNANFTCATIKNVSIPSPYKKDEELVFDNLKDFLEIIDYKTKHEWPELNDYRT
jgi:uncharacterized protein YjbI with pentapeptide repeats